MVLIRGCGVGGRSRSLALHPRRVQSQAASGGVEAGISGADMWHGLRTVVILSLPQ